MGTVVRIQRKQSFQRNRLRRSKKINNNKIEPVENSSAKKTSFGATTSSVVMILGKNVLYMKPLKEIEET